MGATPIVLSTSFYDYTLNPSYVTVNDQGDDVAGHEIWRIGTNTRDLQSWTGANTNVVHRLVVNTQGPNPASIFILDRGHNLAGFSVQLFASNTAGQIQAGGGSNVMSAWVPLTPGMPTGQMNWNGIASPTYAPQGCLTPEGVWWIEFPAQVFQYWGIVIPPMGVGVAPIITNAHLGPYYRLPQYITGPSADSFRTSTKYRTNKVSKRNFRVKTRPMPSSIFSLNRYQIDAPNYAAFDFAIRPLINYNHPWWACRDDTDPTACSLMKPYWTAGDFEYNPTQNPVHREVDLSLEEVYPRTFV